MSLNAKIIERFIAVELSKICETRVDSGTILDLGCGTVPYLDYYKERFSKTILADYEARSPYTNCFMDAHKITLKDSSIDCVLLIEVVEHLHDPKTALSEISRVLKPGGSLIITWPFMHGMHEIPNDYTRFTEFGMFGLLRHCDLEVVKFTRRGGILTVCAEILFYLLSGFILHLRRKSIILDWLFRPFSFLTGISYDYFVRIWLNLFKYERTIVKHPGELLHGWKGHLKLWTLGYCLLARKKTSIG